MIKITNRTSERDRNISRHETQHAIPMTEIAGYACTYIHSQNEIKKRKKQKIILKKLNHRMCLRFYFEIVCGSVFMFILVLLYCVSISSFSRTCSLYCISYEPIHTSSAAAAAVAMAAQSVFYSATFIFIYTYISVFCSCDTLKTSVCLRSLGFRLCV